MVINRPNRNKQIYGKAMFSEIKRFAEFQSIEKRISLVQFLIKDFEITGFLVISLTQDIKMVMFKKI